MIRRWFDEFSACGGSVVGRLFCGLVLMSVMAASCPADSGLVPGPIPAPAVEPAPAAPATAPAEPAAAQQPQVPIILVEKPVYDFGEVRMGQNLRHTFTVRNVGEAPLEIKNVKADCSTCATVGKYPTAIPPGGSGEFPVEVIGRRFRDKFSALVTMETNDPAHRETKLTLAGFMRQYVEVTPPYVFFGVVKPDSVLTRKLTVTNNTEKPLELSINEGRKSETFKAELREVTAGREYEITVTAQPPYAPKMNQFALEIKTNIPEQPSIAIPCTANLPDRLELVPTDISLSETARMQGGLRTLKFMNYGDTPVKILSATPSDANLDVQTKEREPGKQYDIQVSIPANYKIPSGDSAIVLKTDDPEKPELRIPIKTIQPPSAEPQKPASKLIGQPVPKAACNNYDDKEITIGGPSDKVQLLTFYTIWCGYCRRALPGIEKIHQQYKDKGVDVILVDMDTREGPRARTPEQVLEHYKELKLSMPMTMDPEQRISKQFSISSFPTFFVLGKTGVVEAVHFGATTASGPTLPAELDLLLQGKTRADFPAPPPTPPATQPEKPAMKMLGQAAPKAAFSTFDNKEMSIGPESNKVQLLAFYASWCGYSQRAMPTLEKLNQQYKDKGAEVIAISLDRRDGRAARTEEQVLEQYKKAGMTGPMTMDPEGKIAKQFLITGYPTFFLVGKTGNIEAIHSGFSPDIGTAMATELDLLVQGKTRADFPSAQPAPAVVQSRPAS